VRPQTDLERLSSLGISETLAWGDLRPEALTPYDAIVHLAAYVHQDSRQPGYDEHHRRANHQFPVDLGHTAVAAKIPHFVFVSTIAVYGRFRTGQVDENTAPAPSEAYGRSKRAAEVDLATLIRDSATQLTTLRLPMVYGPQIKGNLLPLLDKAARGGKLPLGRARGKRSLLYAGNFASALGRLLATPPSAGHRQIYLLADGQDLSSRELYDHLFQAFNQTDGSYPFPPALLRLGGKLGSLIERLSGRPMPLTSATVHRLFQELKVDDSAFRKDFQWTPPFSPEEGLKKTAEWFQESEG